MKFAGFLGNAGQAAQSDRRASRRGPSALAAVAAVLFMGLSLCGQATPAQAATYVYLYTSGGSQDVTSEILVSNGHTYVMTANPFEIVIDYGKGHVYDIDGYLIGYIQGDGTPPPASYN